MVWVFFGGGGGKLHCVVLNVEMGHVQSTNGRAVFDSPLVSAGVCLGMQLAVVEFARNILGWKGKRWGWEDGYFLEGTGLLRQVSLMKTCTPQMPTRQSLTPKQHTRW